MIWAERQRLPEGFLEEIIEHRRYAEAHAANAADGSEKGWRSTPMRTLAMEIEMELAEEEMDG